MISEIDIKVMVLHQMRSETMLKNIPNCQQTNSRFFTSHYGAPGIHFCNVHNDLMSSRVYPKLYSIEPYKHQTA